MIAGMPSRHVAHPPSSNEAIPGLQFATGCSLPPEHLLALCVCRLQLPPLGQLQKLLIGHNSQGQAPSWHLSMVEVVDETTSQTTYFAADR